MQSHLLRVVMVYVCLLASCILSTSISAHSTYGPDPDPVIETGASLISITCPSPSTPSCTDDFVFEDLADFEANGGSYNIPSECTVTTFMHIGDDTTSTTGCVTTILRTYQIQTNCGSTFSCSHLVMVTDDMPPVITECASIVQLPVTSGCEIAYTPLPVVADDDCGTITQSNDAPAVFEVGQTMVTYTVTDACGNTATCQSIVEVLDEIPPTITCPAEIATQCTVDDVTEYLTPQAFVAAGGTIDDNCNTDLNDFTITTQNDSSNGGSCPETVTRTYVISDAAGNSSTCTQSIVVDDTTLPSFTVPADVANIPCDDVDNLALAGEPTDVDDNCTTAPTVDYTDTSVTDIGGVVTITRTWSVTDDCGNTAADTQTITTVDTTPPIAVCQPGVVYVGADGFGMVDPMSVDGGSSDNCGPLSLSITDPVAICNETGTTIVVELVVTDASGNTSTCEATVAVFDTITPILTAPPAGTLMCTDVVPPPFANIGEFMLAGGDIDDNCVRDMFFTLQSDETVGSCPTVITRIYQYVEADGQMDTAAHVQVVLDTMPPTLTCPANIVIAETDICDTLLTLEATATDACGTVTITNDFDNGDGSITASFSGGTTLITYTATDPCGNTATCEVSVTVAAPPKITFPPFVGFTAEGALIDYVDYDEFAAAGGSVNEACGLDLTTFDFTATIEVDGTDPCMATLTETVTIDDGATECVETRSTAVEDTLPPVLDCSAQTAVFGILDATTCLAEVIFIDPTVMDNFPGDVILTRTEPDYSMTNSTVTWTATDACGLTATCEVDVTILDTSSPIFNIADTTVMCGEEIPQFSSLTEFLDAPGAEVFDCNLDSMSFAFLTDTIFNGNPGKVYVISDIFDNESILIHFISIDDMTNPMIIECSSDMSVSTDVGQCNAQVTVPALMVGDNCDADLIVTNDYNDTDNASGTYPIGETTVVWTVTDIMGNDTMCTFTVTVTDDELPMIACSAAESTQCSIDDVAPHADIDAFVAAGGLISDNCKLDSTSFTSIDTVVSAGPCPIIYDRIYSVQDSTGNLNTCTQRITIDDTIAPEFDAANNEAVTVSAIATSCAALVTYFAPGVLENCAVDSITNDYTNTQDLVDVSFPVGTTFVDFTVVDLCGNTDVHSLEVTVTDDTAPVLNDPVDTIFVNCNPTLIDTLRTDADVVAAGGEIFDNCGYTVDYISTVGTDTLIITYEAIDTSGNALTFTQVIASTDFEGPTFDTQPSPMAAIECGEAFPAQETLTATDGSQPVTIEQDTLPFNMNICADAVVTYVWTATDGCGNTTEVQESFINDRDSEGPQALPGQTTATYTNSPGECGRLVSELTVPDFTDNCSGVESVSTTFGSMAVKVGTFDIDWIAIDSCGNMTTLSQQVTVTDIEPPVLVCDSLVSLNLTDDLANFVYPGPFVEDATDNCGIDTIQIRRLTMVCGDPTTADWSDKVRFCCEEAGDTILVEIRVIDIHGNVSECTTTATVSDKLAPSVMNGLPDVTISCGYLLDTLDLSAFGTFVFAEADRDSIVLDDPFYDATNGYVGKDGLVYENCSATVADSIITAIDPMCNVGTITRVFIITDASGNMTTTEQIITVEDLTPFNANGTDIIWPPTFEWDQCLSPAPDTSISGAPVYLNEDQCSMVAATFSDLNFEIGNGGCAYIRRRWKVIDWCQDTTFTHNQDIYVKNVTAPVFDDAAIDTTICALGNVCVGQVNLSAPATDDCTAANKLKYSYVIDTDNDGTNDLSGSTSSFGRIFDRGTHAVTWTVEDLCGNETSRTDLFTVVECKAPLAICHDGLALSLGNDGVAELWASDVDKGSSDNCTATADLQLSFSSDPDDNVRTYTCDDLGDLEVGLWVTDADGNQSVCIATIEIQDNANACTGNKGTTVMGNVVTQTGVGIIDSKVSIAGAELADYHMTDYEGDYAFMDVTSESDVEVYVEKEDTYIRGVNTLDLVKIQRHILGIENLSSPYQLLAADANSDERISPADLLAIRKLILGVTDGLPGTEAWRFVKEGDTSGDDMSPWPFTDELDVDQGSYVTEGDFVGVKIGDVDNSIEPLVSRGTGTESMSAYLGLVSNEQVFTAGQNVTVPLIVSRDADLQALQFTVDYDDSKLRYLATRSGAVTIAEEHTYLADGLLSLAWSTDEAASVTRGEVVLYVEFEALDHGLLSSAATINSERTAAQAFDDNDQGLEVNLDFINDINLEILLHQNSPNPFFSETVITFDLPEDMEVQFQLFDGTGRVFWDQTSYYPAGTNSIIINDQLQGRKGIFYLKMDAPEYTSVIKMIKIE